MGERMTANEIRQLGFDWPKYAIVEEYLDSDDGSIDITKTIEKMEISQAFYQKQLNDAYAFKMNTGADYSDFTDRFDEYARIKWRLREAINYLKEILRARDDSENVKDQGL
jgi:hypothetical protein